MSIASISRAPDRTTAVSAQRPGVAERRISGLSVDIVPLASLDSLIEPWRKLHAAAVEPNVFLEPNFALAAAPFLGADVQVALVWSCQPRELAGLFPFRVERCRYGLPLAVLTSWSHPYAPFGTPLVHRECVESAISAWLDRIAADPAMPAYLLLPYVHEDGGFAEALACVLARRGSAMIACDRHQRAMLAPGNDRADYLDRAVATKRRRELKRKWRRLQEIGSVEVVRAVGPEAIAAALEDFFRLEAGGWKGRIGTAAAIDPNIRRFMTSAVTGLVARQQAAIRCLHVGGRAIAAAITLRSGRTVWGWKIAYDEEYARYSPGVQIIARLTEDLLADAAIEQVDSLATPDHPMIDHIWRERRTMSDRLIAVKRGKLPFSLVCRLEILRRRSRDALKSIRDGLRARYRPDNTLTCTGRS